MTKDGLSDNEAPEPPRSATEPADPAGGRLPDPCPGEADPGGEAADSQAELEHYARTLEDNAQISREPGPLPPGATHQVVRDEDGTERLERKRFSAF